MTNYVIDTNILLSGKIFFREHKYYTVDRVFYELKKHLQIHKFIYLPEVIVMVPEPESIKYIVESAKATCDLPKLSKTDIEVLALAYQLKYLLLTDDYAMQNLASKLNLKYQSFSEIGIKKEFTYEFICSGCKKIYAEVRRKCSSCGKKIMISRKK